MQELSATDNRTGRLSEIWGRIDRIFCISLKERKDRQESAGKQFARAGLSGHVDFFLTRRHPDDCEQGIFESHQHCLARALEKDARHVLIFEDDVIFSRIDPVRLSAAIDAFMDRDDCQILFLGCLCEKSRKSDMPGIRKIRYACLAHAYLVKEKLARRICGQSWEKTPYDNMLRQCMDWAWVMFPSIAFQSNSPSDNTRHALLENVRRLFGGLKTIQIVNERYHRFRAPIIAFHLLIVSALILWMVLP